MALSQKAEGPQSPTIVLTLQAGLPGYTLPQSPTPSTVLEEESVMLEGPPIWCPGESEAANEQCKF